MKNISNQNIIFKNKKVLLRVDLNVPVDQMDNVTDITRIEACQATIELVLQLGGSCVLLSHLGRPRGKDKRFSLKKIVTTVSTVLNKSILFFEDCIGDSAEQATLELEPGQIILMENLRFYEEETAGDIEFAKKLARLGDFYVNDAFGTSHREHASTAIIAKFFKNKSLRVIYSKRS